MEKQQDIEQKCGGGGGGDKQDNNHKKEEVTCHLNRNNLSYIILFETNTKLAK